MTFISSLRHHLAEVIRGKADVIELLLVGILGAGHILIEDVPGVGKTTLAKALARLLDMRFGRVQFTPDLLPADILGTEVLNPQDGSFSFHQGPVFTNVLLADEINRASPRTQSALLEAMNEGQVTVEGRERPLPTPFIVIATQNPVDFQGTYPLPEAQLDRFLLRLKIGYPNLAAELQLVTDRHSQDPLHDLRPVAAAADIKRLQARVRQVAVAPEVTRYMLAIARATRTHADLQLGISPRGSLALYRASQAAALLAGREYVIPHDVQSLCEPVLAHRIMLTQQAQYGGRDAAGLLAELVAASAVPV
ncbi:MAG TPA: MoxR family ATPase [Sorangium sp.]|nr:MoxR family ATPase [Sorangium sp.]